MKSSLTLSTLGSFKPRYLTYMPVSKYYGTLYGRISTEPKKSIRLKVKITGGSGCSIKKAVNIGQLLEIAEQAQKGGGLRTAVMALIACLKINYNSTVEIGLMHLAEELSAKSTG